MRTSPCRIAGAFVLRNNSPKKSIRNMRNVIDKRDQLIELYVTKQNHEKYPGSY